MKKAEKNLEEELLQLNNEIKSGDIKNMYFFFGSERSLKNRYIELIVDAVLDETQREMNYDVINEDNYSLSSLKDKVETLPFSAEKRVILLKDLNVMNLDEIHDILKELPEHVILIMSDEENKRKRKDDDDESDTNVNTKSKKDKDVSKLIKKEAYIVEMNNVTPSMAIKKIQSIFKQSKKIISKDDAAYMVNRIGTDLSMLDNECAKLISFIVNNEQVTLEDIKEVCIESLESKVFELIGFICNKNIKSAIKSYNILMLSKEPIQLILHMIARQYNIMYEAMLLEKKGYNISYIAEMTEAGKGKEFVVRDCLKQGKSYGLNKVKDILRLCLETDERIKRGEDVFQDLIYRLTIEY